MTYAVVAILLVILIPPSARSERRSAPGWRVEPSTAAVASACLWLVGIGRVRHVLQRAKIILFAWAAVLPTNADPLETENRLLHHIWQPVKPGLNGRELGLCSSAELRGARVPGWPEVIKIIGH